MEEPNDIIQQHPQPLPQQSTPPPPAPLSDQVAPPPQQQEHAPLPQQVAPPQQQLAPQQDEPLPPPAPLPEPPPSPPSPPSYDHPSQDLVSDDRRREFLDTCVPLYNALVIGDWEAAQLILNDREYLLRSSITENFEAPLHVAASTQSINLVQKLVDMMDPADLLLLNRNGNTALSLAAASGNVQIARVLVTANRDLPTIPNFKCMMPLYIAVLFRDVEMVNFLYNESQQLGGRGWTPRNRRWLFLKSVEVGLYELALKLLEVHPQLAESRSALCALARNPSAFNEKKPHFFHISRIVKSIFGSEVESVAVDSKAMQLLRKMWTRIEEKPKSEINKLLKGPMVISNGKQTYPSRVLFVAAEMGNIKFLAELIRRYPDIIWKENDDGLSIFHVAVSHLHENIYNLLYEIGPMKGLIIPFRDSENNNMLHLVGKKPEKSQLQGVSGVAFQMQRKLLWFKEVESMVPPDYKEQKNNSGLTPYQLFTENHKALVSEGEKWMKGTASKCMVVAALIATVVFAVAYTIPGGYEQNDNKTNGFPVFLHNGPFLVFVVLDAISLILSSTSILVFLSILTSRYAQEDFIESLPKYLFVGLLTLFLSIVTMMISFSVSFFVIYRGRFIAIAVIVSVCALIPIISYANLQYPLLKDVYRSIYRSRYLFRPKKRVLYYQNPRV